VYLVVGEPWLMRTHLSLVVTMHCVGQLYHPDTLSSTLVGTGFESWLQESVCCRPATALCLSDIRDFLTQLI
jgi:hypothetical protein